MKKMSLQKNKFTKLLLSALVVASFFFIPLEVSAAWWNPISWVGGGIEAAIQWAAIRLILVPFAVAGWLVGIAGSLLNAVIGYTILELRDNLNSITTINLVWSVIRDLANLSFIFILLYSAIKTIVGEGDGKTKSLIVKIVIAAVLINFSMFFTRVAIDTSNLVALTLYKPIAGCVGGHTPDNEKGLSDCFMEHLGVSSIYSGEDSFLKKIGDDFSTAAILAVAGTTFFVISAFAFFAVSIMLLVRYVNFIYLLIASPLGVVGTIIPSLGGQAKKWKDRLIAECTFAPAYMLATWVVLTIMQGLNTTLAKGQFDDLIDTSGTAGTSPVNSVGLIINFGILIALILGSLVIAKQTANHAGSYGSSVISKGMGFLGGAAAGTTGFFGRRVLGRGGQALSENERLKEAASQKGFKGMMARTALKTTRAAGEGSWDLRSSRAFEAYNKGAKAFGGETLDFGKAGGKGGIKKKMDDDVKAEKKFAESLKPSDVAIESAEQELENAKNAEITEEEYKQEQVRRMRNQRDAAERLAKAEERLREYQAGVNQRLFKPNPELFRKYTQEVASRKSESEAAVRAFFPPSKKDDLKRAMKKERIKTAQESLDGLKGINEETAKKRRIEEMMEEDSTLTKESAKQKLNERLKSDQEKLVTVDSANARRQKQYASSRTDRMFISPGRVGFVGKVSRESSAAAAAIRKQAKEKSSEQKLTDAAKAIAKKDLEEESTSGGAGTPPPPAGAAPSSGGASTPPSP